MSTEATKDYARKELMKDTGNFVPLFRISPQYYAIALPNNNYFVLSQEMLAEFSLQTPYEKRRRLTREWLPHMRATGFEDSAFDFSPGKIKQFSDEKNLEAKIKAGIKANHRTLKLWNQYHGDAVHYGYINGPHVYGSVEPKRSKSIRTPKPGRSHDKNVGMSNAFLVNGQLPAKTGTFSESEDWEFTTRKTGHPIEYKDADINRLLFAAEEKLSGKNRKHAPDIQIPNAPPENSQLILMFDNLNPENKYLRTDAAVARYGLRKNFFDIDKELYTNPSLFRQWVMDYINSGAAKFAVLRRTVQDKDPLLWVGEDAKAVLGERKDMTRIIEEGLRKRGMKKTENFIMFRGTPFEMIGTRYENPTEFAGVGLFDKFDNANEKGRGVYIAIIGKKASGPISLEEDSVGKLDGHPFTHLSAPGDDLWLMLKDDFTKIVSPTKIFIPTKIDMPPMHLELYKKLVNEHPGKNSLSLMLQLTQ